MLSYLIFCHKKDDCSPYSLTGKEEGFLNAPAFMAEIALGNDDDYEGSCLINDSDLLDKEGKGSIIQASSSEVKLLRSVSSKTGNAGKIGCVLDEYKKERHMSLSQEILVQKLVLAVFQELDSKTPYLFIDLSQCEDAPLLLDALRYCYPDQDFLFSLPNNLKFAFAELAQVHQSQVEAAPTKPLTDQEGYRNFFDDLVGVKTLDPQNPTRIEPPKKKEKPLKKKTQKNKTPIANKTTNSLEEKSLKPKKELGIARKDVKPADLKNANWNLFFFYLFTALQFLVPVLFYVFLANTATIYFAIYVVFDVFFFIMASLSICFLRENKDKLTKKYVNAVTFSSPLVPFLFTLLFAILAKHNSWTGYPLYTFASIGLASVVLYAPFLLAFEKLYLPYAKKKKDGKKK